MTFWISKSALKTNIVQMRSELGRLNAVFDLKQYPSVFQ